MPAGATQPWGARAQAAVAVPRRAGVLCPAQRKRPLFGKRGRAAPSPMKGAGRPLWAKLEWEKRRDGPSAPAPVLGGLAVARSMWPPQGLGVPWAHDPSSSAQTVRIWPQPTPPLCNSPGLPWLAAEPCPAATIPPPAAGDEGRAPLPPLLAAEPTGRAGCDPRAAEGITRSTRLLRQHPDAAACRGLRGTGGPLKPQLCSPPGLHASQPCPRTHHPASAPPTLDIPSTRYLPAARHTDPKPAPTTPLPAPAGCMGQLPQGGWVRRVPQVGTPFLGCRPVWEWGGGGRVYVRCVCPRASLRTARTPYVNRSRCTQPPPARLGTAPRGLAGAGGRWGDGRPGPA